MTFSIVAVDIENGEIGFAGASCIYNAGRIGFVQAELGAIATQSLVNFSLGPLFLEKLQEGLSLEQILAHFREIDEGIELRQLGLVTFQGDTLAFTGEKCLDWAGHKTGENYSCQGNILTGPNVIENMGLAFKECQGTLTDKLFAALAAADRSGGDARGKQSARIIIEKKASGFLGSDRLLDINVEDHDDPVTELGRILIVHNFTSEMNKFYAIFEKDKEQAIKDLLTYLGSNTSRYTTEGWAMLAYFYFEIGELDLAKKYYKQAIKISPGYVNILDKFPQLGRLSEEFVSSLLNEIQ